LDLIEVPPDPLAATKLRKAAIVFLEQLIELPRIDTGQAIVVKTDEDRPLGGDRRFPARLIPMTACALLEIFGSRMSRCVSAD